MRSALKIVPEPEFTRKNGQLSSRDLDSRVVETTPELKRTITRSEWERRSQIQSQWGTAPIFRDLTLDECDQVLAMAAQHQYAAREVIVQEGDAGGEVLVLGSGRVKVTQLSYTGDEVILHVKHSGDLISGLGMSEGETYSSTVRALESCQVLSWRRDEFDTLCKSSPTLQRNALQILHDALHILQECFCDLATLRVPSRLARTLVRLADQDGSGVESKPISFTCEELGQMAGTTLFTVSRLLSKWTEMGVIYPENRGIVIEDMEALLALADECTPTTEPVPR
jgi:CRP-like cAMP-binding protein